MRAVRPDRRLDRQSWQPLADGEKCVSPNWLAAFIMKLVIKSALH